MECGAYQRCPFWPSQVLSVADILCSASLIITWPPKVSFWLYSFIMGRTVLPRLKEMYNWKEGLTTQILFLVSYKWILLVFCNIENIVTVNISSSNNNTCTVVVLNWQLVLNSNVSLQLARTYYHQAKALCRVEQFGWFWHNLISHFLPGPHLTWVHSYCITTFRSLWNKIKSYYFWSVLL